MTTLIPYAGKEPLSLRRQSHADDDRDRTIAALWALKMDTCDIARRMGIRESVVANRLAAIRDVTNPMRVLVACEFSGVVRRAFAARGHDVWSCDLLPAEDGSNRHFVGDARDYLSGGWDLLMVAHPPCTRLCNSGVRWLSVPPLGKTKEQMWADLAAGAALFSAFWNAPIDRVCVENPVMHKHAKALIEGYREPAQAVQPWQYGHGETKATCLWLRGLPKLTPTNIVSGRSPHFASPGPNRWKERSRFFPGIAAAMADQWGGDIEMARAE